MEIIYYLLHVVIIGRGEHSEKQSRLTLINSCVLRHCMNLSMDGGTISHVLYGHDVHHSRTLIEVNLLMVGFGVFRCLLRVSKCRKLGEKSNRSVCKASSEYVRIEYHKLGAVKRPRRGSPATSSIANYVILGWGDILEEGNVPGEGWLLDRSC